jgi:hypothetical protein
MLLSARVLTVEDFFRLGTFTPAGVQRDYVWDSQHAEDLFNDIDRVCTPSGEEVEHNSGPYVAVLAECSEEEGELGEALPVREGSDDTPPGYHLGEVMLRRLNARQFEIFDGLQRATTLTILLCVIRDLTSLESLRGRIQGLLEDGAFFRVLLPGADRTLIDEILPKGAAAKAFRRPVGNRGRRIRAARNIFHGHLKTWEDARFGRFGQFLLERTFLVVAETDSQPLARQVFITSNQRGIFLRPIDIFKGQIFDIAAPHQAPAELVRYWDALLQTVGDNNLGEFMRAFDFIQRKAPQGPDHLTKLADYIEKIFGPERLQEVLAEVQQYALTWQELHGTVRQSQFPIARPGIWRLGFFKWFEWKPLALAWLREYGDRQSRLEGGAGAKATRIFENRFERLHRACMIITLAKFSAVDREKIFGNALKQWSAGRDPFSARGQRPGALTFSPRHLARAAETLSTPLHDEEIRLALLRWLESMVEPENLTADAAMASVEHVLPQRPAPDSQWLKDFPNEEERFTACNSIGNLALMDHAENVKITNLDFSLKLPAIKAQSKKYKTLAEIADKTAWRAGEIRARASAMIDLACKQLNIPRAGRS